MSKNIVLNIPHSSVNGVFDDKIGKWTPNAHFVNDCVNKWTDWWTDMLFKVKNMENINSVVFPYSRFVCDVERLKNDPMEERGQGIIYTEFNGYKRNALGEMDKQFLYTLWGQHQNNLKNFLNNESVLIDCHSFPSHLSDADICIGFNDDWSYDEKLINKIKKIFEDYAYKVRLNEPFSNAITPDTDFCYKSLMIEVNKKVYMNEETMILNRNQRQWMRWYGCLEKIYEEILKN